MCSFKFCNHLAGEERELVALFLLSSWSHVSVAVLCLFFAVAWVSLQCVLVTFPGHTH